MTEFNITMNNEKIWKFYNEHPSANIESTNLFFIELIEKSTHDKCSALNYNNSNNSEIIDCLKNIQVQIDNLNKKLNVVQDEISKSLLPTMSQIKKENECLKKIIKQSETNIINDPNPKVMDVLNRWSSSLDKLNK